MNKLIQLWRRLLFYMRRDQFDRELEEEMRFHLEMKAEENLAAGISPEEARYAAQRQFGNQTLLREVSRDMWSFRSLETFVQDLRYGLRMMIKNPGFTAVAVLSLALGIGANTAVFSLVNKALLRPLPVEEPERIVALNYTTGKGRPSSGFSYPNYKDPRDRNDVMTGLIAYEPVPASLSHDGINERVWGYMVSGNYFGVLGARAALGRLISPEDDRAPGAHPVAVISFRCWRQRFGGDPNLAGRSVIVNGRDFTILGVAPPEFIGLEVSYVPEIWFPLMMQSEIRPGVQSETRPGPPMRSEPQPGRAWWEDRGRGGLFVAGRLKPGVNVAQGRAALNVIAAQLAREYPNENEGKTIELSAPGLWGAFGRVFVLGFSGALMGIAGLTLLLVCANLANLLLARAMDRRKEIAVRLALGAGRWRVVRQLLTESLLLSSFAAAFGLGLAFWLIQAPGKFKLPTAVSFALDLDWRVFIFTIAVTFVASAAFGLLPAWQATKPDVVPALKDEPSSSGYRRSWLRGALVVAQVALSLTLMIAAGLALRGLERMQSIDLGFNPQHAVKLSFDLNLQGYGLDRGKQFQKQILDRVRALPGVQAAAVGNYVPPDLHVAMLPINIEGQTPARSGEAPRAGAASVSPEYLRTLGTRLLAGRDFTEQDDERAPRVAVINETFARRFWPDGDAIGKRFSLSGRNDSLVQVVGIAQDGKYRNLSEDPLPFIFIPMKQSYDGLTTLVARTTGDQAGAIAAIRRELQQLDPHLPIFDDETLTENMRLSLLPAQIVASLLGGFGALSLSLAAIGIFGVMSYAVSRRTHEIGVRMALGANRGDVMRLFIGQGMTTVALGVAVGLAGALALTRLMSRLLFGISPTDPLTFAGVALLLAGVALVACYLPARRATRTDPIAALRRE